MWSFYVDDPGTFAQAFIKLNEDFSNGNYISLGQYTGGERNETHYIYATHSDAKSQFTFFPIIKMSRKRLLNLILLLLPFLNTEVQQYQLF